MTPDTTLTALLAVTWQRERVDGRLRLARALLDAGLGLEGIRAVLAPGETKAAKIARWNVAKRRAQRARACRVHVTAPGGHHAATTTENKSDQPR
jgi:hypothetical protein